MIVPVGFCDPGDELPVLSRSLLVGSAVVSDSLERTDARWLITATTSEAPIESFPPSFRRGASRLRGALPKGERGVVHMEGFHGGFYPYIAALRHLQSQRCEICSAGGARFAVPVSSRFPALRDLQCWKSASFQRFPVARPWIHRFPARFASGATVSLMVEMSCSAACVSLIHVSVAGSDSTARSHTIWQY